MMGYPSAALLRELETELLRYFRLRVPPHVDPRDLVAEVWVAMADYRGEASYRTYAFRVARLRLADFYRYRRDSEPLPTSECEQDRRPGPSTLFQRLREQSSLLRALEKLAPVFREVARMHLQGVNNLEIAEQLGLHYNTVRSRLSRALAKIRTELERAD